MKSSTNTKKKSTNAAIVASAPDLRGAAIAASDGLDDLRSRLETIEFALRATPDAEEIAHVRNEVAQVSLALAGVRKRLGEARSAQ